MGHPNVNAYLSSNGRALSADNPLPVTVVDAPAPPPSPDAASVKNAGDAMQVFAYLDSGSADERIASVTTSSASLRLVLVETYSYAGAAGGWRVAGVARALGALEAT
ncbi:MAG: hypothetical protein LBK99_05725 [Opitutaceae bacterium]|jgi:hypothetical protein|nr:hypothetical protein [Opitutaceae bacterium]